MGDDQKWVRRAQDGSRKAFDRLVREYVPRIFRLLYDMTGNYEDAQDLTQEAFMKAFTNLKGYRGDAKFSTWLYRIAYNVAIDFLRKDRKMQRTGWDSQEKIASLKTYDPSNSGTYTGESDAIAKALQNLTHPQRTAVVLNYYHGFRMKEIAEVLGCAEATARVHLFRALRRLKDELGDYAPGA